METDACFSAFVRKWKLLSPSPSLSLLLHLNLDPVPPQGFFPSLCSHLFQLIFSVVARRKGPVQLLLIYLGHAWENGSIFRSSGRGSIRERGCDCREIKPLKVTPWYLDQLMNWAACAPWRAAGQLLQRKCAWEAEGREHYLTRCANCMCLWRRCVVLCVCVCVVSLSVCVWKCVCVHQLCMLLHVCLHTGVSLSLYVCVCCLYRSSYIEGGIIQVLFGFSNHSNSLCFFYPSPESPASFNYRPILVLGTRISMRIFSK